MKYKRIKLNRVQHKSLMKLLYDTGKITIAATAFAAYLKGGMSWSMWLAGGCGALLFILVGVKIEQGAEDD